MRAHRQFAGGVDPAGSFLGSLAERAQRITEVANGVFVREGRAIGVEDAGHSEGVKDALVEEFHKAHSAGFFDDLTRRDVVGVAVLPARAGLEIERLVRPLIENLHRFHRLEHLVEDIILRPVVPVAGGH